MSLPRNVFRALRRTSSRRTYFTGPSSSSSPPSSRLPVSASLALGLAAYATWHITAEKNRIALDARVSSSHAPPTGAGLPPPPDELPAPPTRVGAPPFPPEDALTPDQVESVGAPPSPPEDALTPDQVESDGESAFDPKTGEINWDCPCLGGMAHGPCGMEFREAFSCFVFSEAEPKGMDCIEKFKAMQDCFKDHPEVYAEELDDEEDGASDGGSDPSPALETPGSPETSKTETKSSGSKPPEQGRV